MKNKATDFFFTALAAYMPLSSEIQQSLLSQVVVREVKKNSPLPNFRHEYLFVTQGLLKKEDCDTGDILLFLKPGDFELFATAEETFHYISIEASTVVLFPAQMIVDLISQHKSLFPGYQNIVHRWSALRCRRQDILLLPASEKKAELFRSMGKLINSIPNKDLAKYLDIDNSYFSKL